MANMINNSGLTPLRAINGSPYNGQGNVYYIPSTDGSQYAIGDAVSTAAGGDATGIPQVAKASSASGTPLRGVVAGVFVVPPTGPTSAVGTTLPLEFISVPATKAKNYYVLIIDDPHVIFEIQDDGLNALTATSCNKNAYFTVANQTYPQQLSGTTLTTGTVATTNTFPLKIIGLVQRPNNNFGTSARWQVMINQHEFQGNTAGY